MTVTEEPATSTEIVPTQAATPVRTTDAFIQPAAPAAQVVVAFQAYQELCDRLLSDSDYQRIGNKDFRKKSAWRKLAAAYNISDEIVSKEYERNDRGRILMAEVVVRATAPNGRTGEGIGICDLFEKCCNAELCRNNSRYHTHCTADCDGARHFSNPQHDLPATAHTRAKNRALADLVGAGEVSAEEMNANHRPEPEPEQKSFRERLADLPEPMREAFPKWLAAQGFPRVPKEWDAEQVRAVTKWAHEAESGVLNDGSTPDATPDPEPAEEPADGPADEAVAEAAGDDAVEAEIARVKALKPAQVKAELESRGLDVDGAPEAQRKRLVLAVLREQVAAKEAGEPSED